MLFFRVRHNNRLFSSLSSTWQPLFKVWLCCLLPEAESSRTSLASRTHFEVLGLGLEGQVLRLGLEASSPRKLLCPRLEDSTIFLNSRNFVGKRQKPRRKFANTFFVFLTWSIGVAKGRGNRGSAYSPIEISR